MVSLTHSAQVKRSFPRIEVLGVFGSGKSTLTAKVTKSQQLLPLPEDHSTNPFWGDSYAVEHAGHLPYDLYFMIHHAYLVSASSTEPATATAAICDWSFQTDKLWASMRLGSDYAIYSAAQDAILARIGSAIGYLYLRQPVEVIVDRIARRGRSPEIKFKAFVEKAVEALEALVQRIPSNQLLIVGDDDIDGIRHQIQNWIIESN